MEKEKILIVEDEEIVARDIKYFLEEWGYCVLKLVNNGNEAVETAVELKPDLILMDIHLAGEMDGIEASRQIKETTGTPIIYLTAYADDSTRGSASLTEPDEYLTKPFSELELKMAIEKSLANKKMTFVFLNYDDYFRC